MKTFALDKKPNRFDLSIYDEAVAEWKKTPRRKRPYVLLGKIERDSVNVGGVYQERYVATVVEMVAGLLNSSAADLRNFTNKGCVVLDHWIPKLEELPPMEQREGFPLDHGWVAEMRGIEGQKRAQELRAEIARLKGETVMVSTLTSENAQLKAKLEAFEAKKAAKNG